MISFTRSCADLLSRCRLAHFSFNNGGWIRVNWLPWHLQHGYRVLGWMHGKIKQISVNASGSIREIESPKQSFSGTSNALTLCKQINIFPPL